MTSIQKETLDFLKELSKNNNREWFAKHKARYEAAHQNMIDFTESMLEKMSEHDNIVPNPAKKTLHRIYRDVRFSKDKSPYKRNFSGSMSRATPWLRGGYYFHIEPGNTFVAGGFWAPNADDLKRIREEIAHDAQPLRKIFANKPFAQAFGELKGDAVKTAPKGFSKDHPDIDLIRFKQFVVSKSFTDKEVLSEKFPGQMVQTFCLLRPYFDYMSEVLTTDGNGVRLKL
jgi:uncharacterized protein (TIGR02453 family)